MTDSLNLDSQRRPTCEDNLLEPTSNKAQSKWQSFQSWLSTVASDTWWPETIAICFSMLCSVAIGVTLMVFKDSPVPHLPQSLTLNAMISVLATGSKSAMLFVVGSCLSQVKWIWFREERSLSDVQKLENASRGPLGSLYLLFDRLVCSVASLGAFITILALAFDPFIQQVLIFPFEPVSEHSTASSTPQAYGFFIDSLTSDISAAVTTGLWSDSIEYPVTCPATNCSWGIVKNIGWCSQCQEVKSRVIKNCSSIFTEKDFAGLNRQDETLLSRPCGIEVDGWSVYTWDMEAAAVSFNDTDEKRQELNLLTNLTTNAVWKMYSTWGNGGTRTWPNGVNITNNPDPMLALASASMTYEANSGNMSIQNAQVCTLDICELDYYVSVDTSIPTNVLVTKKYGKKFTILPEELGAKYTFSSNKVSKLNASDPEFFLHCWSADGHIDNLHFDDKDLEVVPADSSKRIETVFFDTTNVAFCLQAGGTMDWSWAADISEALVGRAYYQQRAFCGLDNKCGTRTLDNGSVTFDGTTMTPAAPKFSTLNFEQIWNRGIQASSSGVADSLTRLSLNSSWVSVAGQLVNVVPYVKVRWYWLILPALLNISALILLVYIQAKSARNNVYLWKSSAIALLFHGLDPNTVVPHSTKVSEMEARAVDSTLR